MKQFYFQLIKITPVEIYRQKKGVRMPRITITSVSDEDEETFKNLQIEYKKKGKQVNNLFNDMLKLFTAKREED